MTQRDTVWRMITRTAASTVYRIKNVTARLVDAAALAVGGVIVYMLVKTWTLHWQG